MEVFDDIINGLKEAIDYEKGKLELRTIATPVKPVKKYSSCEVRDVRLRLKMSQALFAAVMGVSTKTVEAWETGRNVPSGSASRFLMLLEKDMSIHEYFMKAD